MLLRLKAAVLNYDIEVLRWRPVDGERTTVEQRTAQKGQARNLGNRGLFLG